MTDTQETIKLCKIAKGERATSVNVRHVDGIYNTEIVINSDDKVPPTLPVRLCTKCDGVVSDAPENDGRHDVVLDTVKPRTYFYCQCGSKMPKQV